MANKDEILEILNKLTEDNHLGAALKNMPDAIFDKIATAASEGIFKDISPENIMKNRANCHLLEQSLMIEKTNLLLPGNEFDTNNLLNPGPKGPKVGEVQDQLKKFYKAALDKLNDKQAPGQKLEPEAIDLLTNKMVNDAMDAFQKSDKNSLEDVSEVTNGLSMVSLLVDDDLRNLLLNLYGGTDPRLGDGVQVPIYTLIGNYNAIAPEAGAEGDSNALLDELFSYQGKDDPLMLEYQNLETFAALDALDCIFDTFLSGGETNPVDNFESGSKFNPSPYHMKPTPDGHHGTSG